MLPTVCRVGSERKLISALGFGDTVIGLRPAMPSLGMPVWISKRPAFVCWPLQLSHRRFRALLF